jgi:hypothetical protein
LFRLDTIIISQRVIASRSGFVAPLFGCRAGETARVF